MLKLISLALIAATAFADTQSVLTKEVVVKNKRNVRRLLNDIPGLNPDLAKPLRAAFRKQDVQMIDILLEKIDLNSREGYPHQAYLLLNDLALQAAFGAGNAFSSAIKLLEEYERAQEFYQERRMRALRVEIEKLDVEREQHFLILLTLLQKGADCFAHILLASIQRGDPHLFELGLEGVHEQFQYANNNTIQEQSDALNRHQEALDDALSEAIKYNDRQFSHELRKCGAKERVAKEPYLPSIGFGKVKL